MSDRLCTNILIGISDSIETYLSRQTGAKSEHRNSLVCSEHPVWIKAFQCWAWLEASWMVSCSKRLGKRILLYPMLVHNVILEGMATHVGCLSSAKADQSAKYVCALAKQTFCQHINNKNTVNVCKDDAIFNVLEASRNLFVQFKKLWLWVRSPMKLNWWCCVELGRWALLLPRLAMANVEWRRRESWRWRAPAAGTAAGRWRLLLPPSSVRSLRQIDMAPLRIVWQKSD